MTLPLIHLLPGELKQDQRILSKKKQNLRLSECPSLSAYSRVTDLQTTLFCVRGSYLVQLVSLLSIWSLFVMDRPRYSLCTSRQRLYTKMNLQVSKDIFMHIPYFNLYLT